MPRLEDLPPVPNQSRIVPLDPTLHKIMNRAIKKPAPPPMPKFTCVPCKFSCATQSEYITHLATNEHKANMVKIIPPEPEVIEIDVDEDEKTVCEICHVYCESHDQYLYHIQGKRHLSKVYAEKKAREAIEKPTRCNVCNITCPNHKIYQNHIKGKKHIKNTTKGGDKLAEFIQSRLPEGYVPMKPLITPVQGRYDIRCEFCNVVCNGRKTYIKHTNGSKHMKKILTLNKTNPMLKYISKSFGEAYTQLPKGPVPDNAPVEPVPEMPKPIGPKIPNPGLEEAPWKYLESSRKWL